MNSLSPELKKQITAILATGDEAKFRQFIDDHMQEFPQSVQDDLILALVEEAVDKQADRQSSLDHFKKEALAALDILGNAKGEIEKQEKLREIKKSIKE